MENFSFLGNAGSNYIEDVYQLFKKNPELVDAGWRAFFEGFEFSEANSLVPKNEHLQYNDEFKVINLINGYRERGHLFTKTNPVRTRRKHSPTLDPENFGLLPSDLNKKFLAGNEIGIGPAKLSDIIEHLRLTYCQSLGIEFAYIRNKEIETWLKTKMEGSKNLPKFSASVKKNILNKLNQSVNFESFLHKRFPGQKSFSLEGCEALIPALEAIIEKGSQLNIREVVIGMPHRGRLNVLANILHKPFKDIFSEFEGKEMEDATLLGDVKYHLGFSNSRSTSSGQKIHLMLTPNPSHLEAVNPVVEGIVRAYADSDYENDYSKIVPILIHGDASVAGQGIIYEVLQMSELEGFRTGGTIHLVVNNQLGFTTNYLDGRSSIYCTDIAKIIQSPILHVNADDVEEVVYAVNLAVEFRQQFHKDVFVDLLGYRKYGHNEGDEPRFTQPTLYQLIEKHPNPLQIYIEKLIADHTITSEEASSLEKEFIRQLDKSLEESELTEKTKTYSFFEEKWAGIVKAEAEDFEISPPTYVDEKNILLIAGKITELPPGKPFYRKIVRLQQERHSMIFDKQMADWAMAELLAYGSLLYENIPVRLSGQDSQRGTFSHRHAMLTVEDSEEKYAPLNHLSENQARFQIYNSLLSEYGVLGFEYGYALASPEALTLWEAQYGDFMNGAQIIIDQYISSAEEKWKVMNGLVLLLPHGYEGQGPEHSSARPERFLSSCANLNIQVVNCTTPANFFHVLRRQVHRDFRKPLVVFTPKSLLRHPKCISPLSDFTHGKFQEIIDDESAIPDKIQRVVFCSGKIYYKLLDEKIKINRQNTALIRIEQLYPFPEKQFNTLIQKYDKAQTFLWVQEEPANMGAWGFLLRHIKSVNIMLVARPESGSPATGSGKLHTLQQRKIIEKALDECTCDHRDESCKMTCIPDEWHWVEKNS